MCVIFLLINVRISRHNYLMQKNNQNQQKSTVNNVAYNTGDELTELLKQHAIFKASEHGSLYFTDQVVTTGFPELDQLLTIGGWPLGAIIELGVTKHGMGELRLLLPAIQALSGASSNNNSCEVMWIAPPFLPNAQALKKFGFNTDCLTVVQTKTQADAFWATEEVIKSKACVVVLTWISGYSSNQLAIRRLQLAAQKATILSVLIRDSHCLQQASVSRLKLLLSNTQKGELAVTVHKQPQGWGGGQCVLSLPPYYSDWQRIPTPQLPHCNRHYGVLSNGIKRSSTMRDKSEVSANVLSSS